MGRGQGSCSVGGPAGRRRQAGRPRYWTDARLEAALRAYCAGFAFFPTLREFDADGRQDLRAAVTQRGVGYWAGRLDLPVQGPRLRRRYGIADAVRDAERVIESQGRLPGEKALRRLGYQRLATVVRQSGGAAEFCRRNGLG